jgi:hypothetical protein
LSSEYILNVPVNISAIGPGHAAAVTCTLKHQGSGEARFAPTLATQSAPVPLDRVGNYAGTIAIKVVYTPSNAAAGANAVPDAYECFLDIDHGNPPPSKSRPHTISAGSL